MSQSSFFEGTCRFCGDTFQLMLGESDACGRCDGLRIKMRNLSLVELARIIDAAAMVPEGTYKIVNTALPEKDNG